MSDEEIEKLKKKLEDELKSDSDDEAIKHIKNIFNEVIKLNEKNSNSGCLLLALLLLLMGTKNDTNFIKNDTSYE